MGSIATIREFRTKHFRVIVDAIEEDCPDISFDETGELVYDLERGKYVLFCARARVLLDGREIASDYLGNCIYSTYDDFQDHRECAKRTRELRANGSSAVCGSYFTDMIKTVIYEARGKLSRLHAIRVRNLNVE